MLQALVTALNTEIQSAFTTIAPVAALVISGYIGHKLLKRFLA